MEYARKNLNRLGPAVRSGCGKRFVDRVDCAYCSGQGADPKYRSASGCPVCRGAGSVRVTPPEVACRRCAGSSRVGGDLICLTCKGVGAVSVADAADTCGHCDGTGEAGVFYCHACKGLGIV